MGSRGSDTKIAENWEDPEEEESSVGESDMQGEWEERINLICTEYGMTKPHRQAHYRERAIKIVDEFVTNDPLKLIKGSTRYYDTIVKTFGRLAIRYRQNRDSKRSGTSTPNALMTPGCSVARTGEATAIPLPPHAIRSRLPIGKANELEPLAMIARRTIGNTPIVKQESSLGPDLRAAFGGPQRMQRDIPPHM